MAQRVLEVLLGALVATGLLAASPVLEREPNDTPDQAAPLSLGEEVRGLVHHPDGKDHYRVLVPEAGVITLILGDLPPDGAFQVGLLGLHAGPEGFLGYRDVTGGADLRWEVVVQAPGEAVVWVMPYPVAASVTRGRWSALRFTRAGPWYRKPRVVGEDDPGPARHDGAPVLPPAGYSLSVHAGRWPPAVPPATSPPPEAPAAAAAPAPGEPPPLAFLRALDVQDEARLAALGSGDLVAELLAIGLGAARDDLLGGTGAHLEVRGVLADGRTHLVRREHPGAGVALLILELEAGKVTRVRGRRLP